LLQLQHGDEVGVSFGLARFILPYLQLQTAADAFRTISSMVARLPSCRSIGLSQLMKITLLLWDGRPSGPL
jgi:hypothetical protein